MKYCKLIWIVITFIILVWIYYLFISPNIFKKREYAVPNISGLSEIDAIRLLEDNDFNYSINYIQGDNNIVSYTYPKEGSMIYKSNTIDVYITKQMSCNYNSFVGLIYDNNIEMINDYCHKYKINLNVLYEENNTYSSGLIFYQSKTVNDIIVENDELILKVAVSNEYVTMPNLVNMHILDAIKILDEYNLKYNIIYYNSVIENDIIISQSIDEGTIIKKGNNNYFNIYVSNGLC